MNKLISFFLKSILIVTSGIRNRIVYLSFPDYDDMLRGLLPHLKKMEVIILVSKDGSTPLWLDEYNVKVVDKKSIKGFYYLLSAQVIYFTHGIYSFYPKVNAKRQKIINLWHGMPLKNIGYLDGKTSVPDCHYCLATSDFFADLMSKAFGLSLDDVIVSGLPRNDLLMKETKNDYLLALKNKYSTVVCWLPTYRKSNIGDIRFDGKSDYNIKYNWMIINEYYKRQNAILILKPHPMDADINTNIDFSNIIILTEDSMNDVNTSLYEVLSITDMLWTDYSSVFIDYALTNKPIVFISPDISEYKASRGFAYDTDIYPLPGRSFKDVNEVLSCSLRELSISSNYDNSLYQKYKIFNFEALK